jgi:hypothetical protein
MVMERREQVFVSSTYLDLREERQEVIQTLLEADCIPSGMELFPASDDDRWTLIQRVIDDSDYYLLVIGGRYGSVDPETELSYTEMEFDYAASVGKPVLAFIHGEPGSIPADKTELDPSLREKLDSFRAKVSERIVKYWDSPQALGGQVAKSLIQIRKTHPAEGWVRARNALTPEVERELAELRASVAELSRELSSEQQRHDTPVPIPVSDLQQGDDNVEILGTYDILTKEDLDAGRNNWSARKRVRMTFNTTWNRIFEGIAADMLDEASEDGLRESLNRVMVDVAKGETRRIRVADGEFEVGAFLDVDVRPDSFTDVKVQFFALGLIERSERRRAVSDSNTYWTLTPTGKDQLMRLRARRRDPVTDPEGV